MAKIEWNREVNVKIHETILENVISEGQYKSAFSDDLPTTSEKVEKLGRPFFCFWKTRKAVSEGFMNPLKDTKSMQLPWRKPLLAVRRRNHSLSSWFRMISLVFGPNK